MARYMIVSMDPGDTVIRGGPVEWDGAAPYAPPDGTRLITEVAAAAGGYTHPPRPAREVNEATVRGRLAQALELNAAFLAVGSPTAGQNAAQVRRLTQECNALIRVVLRVLDTDDGTG